MHLISSFAVAVIGGDQIFYRHLDGLHGERVGKRICRRRYIGFQRVRQRIHTGVSDQRRRHALYQRRIYDSYIRRDIVIRDRIFDIRIAVGDNRK